MNTTVGRQQRNQTVFWTHHLVFTLCFFLLAPVGTAYAQGTTDDTGRVSQSPSAPQASTRLMPNARQPQWNNDSLPPRRTRRPYKIPGVLLSVFGTLSAITGGALVLMAADNNKQVKDCRDEWMVAIDPNELKQLKQKIVDLEDTRDLQNAFGIGALSVGAVSLIAGIIMLSIVPERPGGPDSPRHTQSPRRLRPIIGATDVGLAVTF
jgi:hypothetical protein